MSSESVPEGDSMPRPNGQIGAAGSAAADERLIEKLVAHAQAEHLQLLGQGDLLQQLTKRVLLSGYGWGDRW